MYVFVSSSTEPLEDNPFYCDIKDQSLIEKFKAIADKQKGKKSLKVVLLGIYKNNSWSKEDEEILLESSSSDYFKLFTSTHDETLDRMIKAGLSFGKISNATENYRAINASVTEALKKIGRQNSLNARRVSKYGIAIEGT